MADPPRRVNCFNGRILTSADMAVERQYNREMRYLHNRLHGDVPAWGLEVAVTDGDVHVSAGMAIDVDGREIVVTEPLTLPLKPVGAAGPWVGDLVIVWHETPESPVPGPDGALDFARWVEQPELAVVAEGAAAAEELLLARLTLSSDRTIDVDTSVRRPLGPG